MRMRNLLLAAVLVWSIGVLAQTQSPRECREGGDFIRNAALSRDGGTTRESFVARLEQDLLTIRAFSSELRWFVHSTEDEAFLRAEVEAVFDAPETGEKHRAGFLERCTRRAGRQAAPNT